MAHYAYLDENNIVTQVIVGRDEDDLVQGVTDWEVYYGAKRCSYNTHGGVHWTIDPETDEPVPSGEPQFRKNYPAIGDSYDPDRDAFIPPTPYPSWVLNEDTCLWEAPVPYPDDGNMYTWNEETQSWDLVEE
jgi:hypothetical protein